MSKISVVFEDNNHVLVVQLKEFSLIAPVIKSVDVFQAIETVIPPETIEQTISTTQSQEERKRKLPSSLVVCLIIAMSLWSNDSMATVLKNLVQGLSRQWTKLGSYWRVPNSASISEARARVGCQVMSQLFARIVRPMATLQTPGAFLGGLRVMAVDGTVLDIPDSASNARVFGYPASRPGTSSAFPRIAFSDISRSRNSFDSGCLDVSISHWRASAGIKTLRSVAGGMLLMWDRGLHSYAMVHGTLSSGSHSLLRTGAEEREI